MGTPMKWGTPMFGNVTAPHKVYALDKAATGAKKYIAATFKGFCPLHTTFKGSWPLNA